MDADNILAEAALDRSIFSVPLVAILLFTLETYHMVSHACILFRLRMLPKRDLVRVRTYFLVDLLTVTCSALYTGQVLWLAALQNIQHVFFFVTWNKNWYCIRVINWSSLDWVVKPADSSDTKGSLEKADNPDRLDVTLGTAFDLVVHLVYAYYLLHFLAPLELMTSLVLVACLTKLVLFNKRFSWSDPNKVPKWVGKRVGTIGAAKN